MLGIELVTILQSTSETIKQLTTDTEFPLAIKINIRPTEVENLQIYSLLVNLDILQIIVEETNQYALQILADGVLNDKSLIKNRLGTYELEVK